MTPDFDTNVSHYTLSELIQISGVEDLGDQDEIIAKTDRLINKFKKKNPAISVFFTQIQSQLLQFSRGLSRIEDDDDENGLYGDGDEDEPENKIVVESFGNMNDAVYPEGEKQINDWYKNQYLPQDNKNQQEKITDRKNKINIFGNQHTPMKQEQIATTDTYQVPVKQDSLNPNLKNTISRFINLDSQFRQYTGGSESSSTDYTLDLSDTLKDVLSLRLYSYQIPFNWYALDTAYGNTCFWINDLSYNIGISVPPGNYNPSQFVTVLNAAFATAGFTFPATSPINTPVSYNINNALITLSLYGGVYNSPDPSNPGSFTISGETIIIFFDFTANLLCSNTCGSKSNHYFNNTLGWNMGYRFPYIPVLPGGNTGTAVLDLNGPKYLILVIDDYNQNHVNNSLVSITQFSSVLKVPVYYSPDLPYYCIDPEQQGSNLQQIVREVAIQNAFSKQVNGLLIAGKYENDYTPTQIILPSAPRTLTRSQIYTINEINKNKNNLTNYLSKAPTSSDILAMIPIKTSGLSTGTVIVEFSGSLQDNNRTYFGPVNIDRLSVKLLDDKGNIVNMNGTDWCVTLICDCLYQY